MTERNDFFLEKNHIVLRVSVGDPAQTYSIGDLINAVDSVVYYFRALREQTDADIAAALRLYAAKMDAENARKQGKWNMTRTESQQDYADDQEDTECPWCKGRGWNSSANGKAYCPDCEGTGRVPVGIKDEEN